MFVDGGGRTVLMTVTISAARIEDDKITFKQVSLKTRPTKASFTVLVTVISRLLKAKENLAETFWDKRQSDREG